MFTLTEMAAHFRSAAARCEPELVGLVETITMRAAVMARSYIGHAQEDWPPLSSATVEGFRHEAGFWITGKRELGFSGPDYEPLRRTRQLELSIDFQVDGLMGIVGSPDKVALYHEMGTAGRYPMPPRPIFSKAMMEAATGIEELAEVIVVRLLVPK